jgi:transposase
LTKYDLTSRHSAHTETEECGERRLNHSDGEAAKFYRELVARGVRVGMEAGYSRWFERLLAELGYQGMDR